MTPPPRAPVPPLRVPPWAWWTLAALAAVVALPWVLAAYARWWDAAFGRVGALVEAVLPRVAP